MSKTRLQLINQAAKRLGVLASGQTLASDDYDEINALWDPLIEELDARQVYTVQDADSIEDAAYLHLADLLAIKAAPNFGLTAENLAAKGVSKAISEDELEVIEAGPPTKRVLTIERFWG